MSSFLRAACCNDAEALERLLAGGADIDEPNGEEMTMTSPRYEDLEEADREWRTGAAQDAVRRLERIIRHPNDTDRRLKAVDLLGEFGRPDRTPDHVVPGVGDPDGEAQALTGVAVPVLIHALGDPDDRVRLRACAALGKIGPHAAEAIPHLCALLHHSNRALQTKAGIVLKQLQPDSSSEPT